MNSLEMPSFDKHTLRARTLKRTKVVAALGAAALAASLLCSTREAHAGVRFGIHGGAQAWIPASTPISGRNVAGVARAEVMGSLIPWLYLGGYGQMLSNFGDAPIAGGVGATFGIRPTIPLSPVHPFAYAGIGYTGFPTAANTVTHWGEASLGGGLTVSMGQYFGFEVRAAASKMFAGPSGDQASPFAFLGTVGFTLHL